MPYNKRLTGSNPQFPVGIVDNESGFATLYFNDAGDSTSNIVVGFVIGRLYIHNKQSDTYEWRNVIVENVGSTIQAICNYGESQYSAPMYIELTGLRNAGASMVVIPKKIEGSTIVSGMHEIVAGEFDWTK